MKSFVPEGLSSNQFEMLSQCSNEAADVSLPDLIRQANTSVQAARFAHDSNSMVNVRLAEAIITAIRTVVDDWDNLPSHAQPWCRGMVQYFIMSDDDENDFSSPIGFEDDVEVLNACLVLAGREDLCINSEDYDDV